MSDFSSPQEVRQHHIDKMGNTLGPHYHALWTEVAWLYSKWGEYVGLFGTEPSRITLINEVAGHFFRIVQDSLLESTLLHITRLTDPPKSCGKTNLTIKQLPALITEETLKKQVKELIDVAESKTEFCRDWRNRHLAHTDLELILSSSAEPLTRATKSDVGEALLSISKVLNEVSAHYMDSTTYFEGIGGAGRATSLIRTLDIGRRAEEERHERLKKTGLSS